MVGTVRRASERAAAAAHQDLKEGLDSLATITTLAPWVGLLCTVIQIANSFVACDGERSTCMGAVAERLSQSLWPAASGLFVGLLALSFHRYLAGSLQALDMEMKAAIPELVKQLGTYRGPWHAEFETASLHGRPLFGGPSIAGLEKERAFRRRSMYLAGVALLAGSCVELMRSFVADSLPLESAAWTACKHVLFVFGVSFILAHPLWSRVLHRQPGGLGVLAAVMCLCWCVGEFIVGVHTR